MHIARQGIAELRRQSLCFVKPGRDCGSKLTCERNQRDGRKAALEFANVCSCKSFGLDRRLHMQQVVREEALISHAGQSDLTVLTNLDVRQARLRATAHIACLEIRSGLPFTRIQCLAACITKIAGRRSPADWVFAEHQCPTIPKCAASRILPFRSYSRQLLGRRGVVGAF